MSYHDETQTHYCDGPGCEAFSRNRHGWRSVARHAFRDNTLSTEEDFCSPSCERRAKGFSHCLESALQRVQSGSETMGQAVRRAMGEDLVLGRTTPAEALPWARLMAHAWILVGTELQARVERAATSFDEGVMASTAPGPVELDDPAMMKLVETLMSAMHKSGELIGTGQATLEECVNATVEELVPDLRQLALRRQSSLQAEMQEVVFPFRRAAEYQVAIAHALELECKRVLTKQQEAEQA